MDGTGQGALITQHILDKRGQAKSSVVDFGIIVLEVEFLGDLTRSPLVHILERNFGLPDFGHHVSKPVTHSAIYIGVANNFKLVSTNLFQRKRLTDFRFDFFLRQKFSDRFY